MSSTLAQAATWVVADERVTPARRHAHAVHHAPVAVVGLADALAGQQAAIAGEGAGRRIDEQQIAVGAAEADLDRRPPLAVRLEEAGQQHRGAALAAQGVAEQQCGVAAGLRKAVGVAHDLAAGVAVPGVISRRRRNQLGAAQIAVFAAAAGAAVPEVVALVLAGDVVAAAEVDGPQLGKGGAAAPGEVAVHDRLQRLAGRRGRRRRWRVGRHGRTGQGQGNGDRGGAQSRSERREAHPQFRRIAAERAWAGRPSACGQGHGGVGQGGEGGGVAADDRGALDEVVDRQARREPRGAAGGQDVVRAGHIVADRLWRVAAEEDRPGVAHPVSEDLRIIHGEFNVLGRDAVHQGRGAIQSGDHHRPVVAPGGGGVLARGQGRSAGRRWPPRQSGRRGRRQ